MPYKPTTKKGTRRPRRYAGRKARPSGKKSFAARVKAVLSKQVENKTAMALINEVTFNSAATSQADVMPIMPLIAQGTDNAQRVGDEITAKSLNMRGHIRLQLKTEISSYCRVAVRMMVITPKRYPIFTDAYANYASWINTVLSYGTGEQGLDGSLRSLYLPVNRHSVTCHYDKLTYLSQDFVNGLTSSTSQGVRETIRFFNINLKCKNKKLSYDNLAPANLPNNYGPVLLVSYVCMDGVADTLSANIAVSSLHTLNYEDA